VCINIPPEVTNYVENTRNPDIFTREFVEMVQRMNQMLKGRTDGMRLMRDTLVMDLLRAIPALKDDLQKVIETTGDTLPEIHPSNTLAT
jgi:mediator of RNA polymerase II transcription subunit 10